MVLVMLNDVHWSTLCATRRESDAISWFKGHSGRKIREDDIYTLSLVCEVDRLCEVSKRVWSLRLKR